MKNSTCLRKWLRIGLPAMVLSLFLLLAPVPVHADSLDDFIGFLQSVEQQIGSLDQYGFPVSAQELADSKDSIQCLINANGNTAATGVCLQGIDGLPDEIDMIVDVYIYWMDSDYVGLAYYVGGDFVCIFLDYFLTGGSVDICGLLEELAELAEGIYDAGKAILEFFGEAAGAVWGAAQDVGCALGIGGCDDSPSVPPDVYLFGLLQPYAAEGVEKREAVDSGAFDNYLNGLKTKILAEANKPIEEFNQTGVTIPLFTMADMTAAAAKYTDLVNSGWTDDIIRRENKNRKQRVDLFSIVVESFIDEVADACSNNQTCEAVSRFNSECTESINNQQKFAHIDRWKNTPIKIDGEYIGSVQQHYKTTSQVCGDFYEENIELYQGKARAYLVEQKICTESGPSLSCGDLDKYTTCDRLMSAFGEQGACSVNLKAAADEARARMMARFRKEGSRFYPPTSQLQTSDTTITKKSRGGTSIFVPKEFPCYRPTHEYFFKQFYNDLFGDLPQKVLRAVSKEDAAYATLRKKVTETVAQLNSNSEYADCNFDVSEIDPLLVAASSTYCLSLAKDNNDAPGFEFLTTKQSITIDGQDKPLMFSDHAGELEKQFKKTRLPELVNQKIDITASMKRNSVAGKLNPAAKLAPAARLSGAGTVAVSPGRQLQTPAAGQRVMSGKALPGQQVAGTSSASGIEAKKSPPVVQKKDGGMQKKGGMEILPISRRNTTSRPVTIRIKNVPFSRLPFELRYRPGTGGFYKPVQRPVHRFSRTNELTTLTLSLKQAGQYQVRFRSSGRGPWDKWHNFTVAGNPARVTGQTGKAHLKSTGPKAINPQPEPPGKTRRAATARIGQNKSVSVVSSKPTRNIRLIPVTIKTPRNGQKFMLTGRNLHVRAEISHAPGQKVQVAVEREIKGRFATLSAGISTHRMKAATTVDLLISSTGKYRLRVKGTGKNARWGRWTTFTVDRLMKKPPKLHSTKPTVQATKQ